MLAKGCAGRIVYNFLFALTLFVFKEMQEASQIDLEVVLQGTLVERLRMAGARLGGFLTPAGVDSAFGDGKPVREIDGKEYVPERLPLCDFASF